MIQQRLAQLSRALPVVACGLILMLPGAVAAAESSAWVKGPSSSARLVSAGGLRSDRTYLPGIEIELTGQALTYWRTPGESGVPPVASFAGSENLASADLRFPAPQRLQEGGSEVYGYRRHVVFPLRVVPADPSKPVQLVVDLHYAACDKICVPAEAKANLSLRPDDAPTAFTAALAAAEASVPRPPVPGAPPLALVRRDAKTWEIPAEFASQGGDLFAEAPDGWFFETHARPHAFELVLAERPSEGDDVPVILTFTTPKGSWERSMKLDVKGATP